MPPRGSSRERVVVMHRYQWLWEPLEDDATFVLRAMFGAKAAYLDGRMVLCFSAGEEPWRGVLVCTDKSRHDALIASIPALVPHTILPKWLYLPESTPTFERDAEKLVQLARKRDSRIGIEAKGKRPPGKRREKRIGL